MRFIEPAAEMPHHVKQHLVAIGDQQRPHADSNSWRARDQRGGGGADRFGAGDQIGLVRLEEAEHRGEQRRFARSRAQVGGIEPGQREQPLRPRGLTQRPGERVERQRGVLFPRALIA